MSDFYDTSREGGPRVVTWVAALHGYLKPGDHVVYDAQSSLGPLGIEQGEHVITELIDHREPVDLVTAILDGGRWEVQADNLIRVKGKHHRDP